ncbi:MAG: mevalonate kinase [Saprospiraceae bacterium]
MTITEKFYSAKLLLLGEHIVLKGAQALAMPLPFYGGNWNYAKEDTKIEYPLTDFVTYLKELNRAKQLLASIDLTALEKQINAQIHFVSNIPIGYGLGSSGAFVAAVYDQFCIKKKTNLTLLKQELAQLESHFHGSSSGTDPLICYLNQAIVITPDVGIQTVQLPAMNAKTGYTIFLLDTKIPRKTGPYVQTFLANCEQKDYLERCQVELIPTSNDAISAFLQAEWQVLFQLLHEISFFQFKYFSEMIPVSLRQIWLDGLSSNIFKLKLCGAGGGGFMLGMTKNFTALQQRYAGFSFQKVYEL